MGDCRTTYGALGGSGSLSFSWFIFAQVYDISGSASGLKCETFVIFGTFKEVFDEEKVVANPELSLEDGAIYGWSKHNAYFYQMLSIVGLHYGFSIDKPFNELFP